MPPMTSPLISVVMPVFNGASTVGRAIESVLSQSIKDFEFIIVDDASTDETPSILSHYSQIDPRIRIIRHDNNSGTVSIPLNTGCRIATGKYIARMDADDISLPNRFKEQVGYLERCPEVGVLGTSIGNIDEQDFLKGISIYPSLPDYVHWALFFGCPVAHPSVMFRRAAIAAVDFYDPDITAEDYDLWLRASSITKIANLSDVLLHYRAWNGSVSKVHEEEILASAIYLAHRHISRFLNKKVNYRQVELLWKINRTKTQLSIDDSDLVEQLIEDLYYNYVSHYYINKNVINIINHDIATILRKICIFKIKYSIYDSVALFLKATQFEPIHTMLLGYIKRLI